jgi:hypothetical protein
VVIIHTDTLKQKISNFIQANQILQSNKDISESFLKHIQQKIYKCNTIIEKKFDTNKTHGTKT